MPPNLALPSRTSNSLECEAVTILKSLATKRDPSLVTRARDIIRELHNQQKDIDIGCHELGVYLASLGSKLNGLPATERDIARGWKKNALAEASLARRKVSAGKVEAAQGKNWVRRYQRMFVIDYMSLNVVERLGSLSDKPQFKKGGEDLFDAIKADGEAKELGDFTGRYAHLGKFIDMIRAKARNQLLAEEAERVRAAAAADKAAQAPADTSSSIPQVASLQSSFGTNPAGPSPTGAQPQKPSSVPTHTPTEIAETPQGPQKRKKDSLGPEGRYDDSENEERPENQDKVIAKGKSRRLSTDSSLSASLPRALNPDALSDELEDLDLGNKAPAEDENENADAEELRRTPMDQTTPKANRKHKDDYAYRGRTGPKPAPPSPTPSLGAPRAPIASSMDTEDHWATISSQLESAKLPDGTTTSHTFVLSPGKPAKTIDLSILRSGVIDDGRLQLVLQDQDRVVKVTLLRKRVPGTERTLFKALEMIKSAEETRELREAGVDGLPVVDVREVLNKENHLFALMDCLTLPYPTIHHYPPRRSPSTFNSILTSLSLDPTSLIDVTDANLPDGVPTEIPIAEFLESFVETADDFERSLAGRVYTDHSLWNNITGDSLMSLTDLSSNPLTYTLDQHPQLSLKNDTTDLFPSLPAFSTYLNSLLEKYSTDLRATHGYSLIANYGYLYDLGKVGGGAGKMLRVRCGAGVLFRESICKSLKEHPGLVKVGKESKRVHVARLIMPETQITITPSDLIALLILSPCIIDELVFWDVRNARTIMLEKRIQAIKNVGGWEIGYLVLLLSGLALSRPGFRKDTRFDQETLEEQLSIVWALKDLVKDPEKYIGEDDNESLDVEQMLEDTTSLRVIVGRFLESLESSIAARMDLTTSRPPPNAPPTPTMKSKVVKEAETVDFLAEEGAESSNAAKGKGKRITEDTPSKPKQDRRKLSKSNPAGEDPPSSPPPARAITPTPDERAPKPDKVKKFSKKSQEPQKRRTTRSSARDQTDDDPMEGDAVAGPSNTSHHAVSSKAAGQQPEQNLPLDPARFTDPRHLPRQPPPDIVPDSEEPEMDTEPTQESLNPSSQPLTQSTAPTSQPSQSRLAELESLLKAAQEENGRLSGKLVSLEGDLGRIKSEKEGLEGELKSEKDGRRADGTKHTSELTTASSSLATLQQSLQAKETALKTAEDERDASRNDLAALKKSFNDESAEWDRRDTLQESFIAAKDHLLTEERKERAANAKAHKSAMRGRDNEARDLIESIAATADAHNVTRTSLFRATHSLFVKDVISAASEARHQYQLRRETKAQMNAAVLGWFEKRELESKIEGLKGLLRTSQATSESHRTALVAYRSFSTILRAALSNTRVALATSSTALTTSQTRLAAYQFSFRRARTRLASQSTSITGLNVSLNSFRNQLTESQGRESTLAGELEDTERKRADLWDKEARLRIEKEDLEEVVGSLRREKKGALKEVDRLGKVVTALESDKAGLSERVGELEEAPDIVDGEWEELSREKSDLEEKVVGLETERNGLKEKVIGLDTEVAGFKTEVSGLKGELGTLKQEVVTLGTAKSSAEGDVAILESQVDTISTDLIIRTTQLSTERTLLANANTSISRLTSSLALKSALLSTALTNVLALITESNAKTALLSTAQKSVVSVASQFARSTSNFQVVIRRLRTSQESLLGALATRDRNLRTQKGHTVSAATQLIQENTLRLAAESTVAEITASLNLERVARTSSQAQTVRITVAKDAEITRVNDLLTTSIDESDDLEAQIWGLAAERTVLRTESSLLRAQLASARDESDRRLEQGWHLASQRNSLQSSLVASQQSADLAANTVTILSASQLAQITSLTTVNGSLRTEVESLASAKSKAEEAAAEAGKARDRAEGAKAKSEVDTLEAIRARDAAVAGEKLALAGKKQAELDREQANRGKRAAVRWKEEAEARTSVAIRAKGKAEDDYKQLLKDITRVKQFLSTRESTIQRLGNTERGLLTHLRITKQTLKNSRSAQLEGLQREESLQQDLDEANALSTTQGKDITSLTVQRAQLEKDLGTAKRGKQTMVESKNTVERERDSLKGKVTAFGKERESWEVEKKGLNEKIKAGEKSVQTLNDSISTSYYPANVVVELARTQTALHDALLSRFTLLRKEVIGAITHLSPLFHTPVKVISPDPPAVTTPPTPDALSNELSVVVKTVVQGMGRTQRVKTLEERIKSLTSAVEVDTGGKTVLKYEEPGVQTFSTFSNPAESRRSFLAVLEWDRTSFQLLPFGAMDWSTTPASVLQSMIDILGNKPLAHSLKPIRTSLGASRDGTGPSFAMHLGAAAGVLYHGLGRVGSAEEFRIYFAELVLVLKAVDRQQIESLALSARAGAQPIVSSYLIKRIHHSTRLLTLLFIISELISRILFAGTDERETHKALYEQVTSSILFRLEVGICELGEGEDEEESKAWARRNRLGLDWIQRGAQPDGGDLQEEDTAILSFTDMSSWSSSKCLRTILSLDSVKSPFLKLYSSFLTLRMVLLNDHPAHVLQHLVQSLTTSLSANVTASDQTGDVLRIISLVGTAALLEKYQGNEMKEADKGILRTWRGGRGIVERAKTRLEDWPAIFTDV